MHRDKAKGLLISIRRLVMARLNERERMNERVLLRVACVTSLFIFIQCQIGTR